jgi:hypothetical protein
MAKRHDPLLTDEQKQFMHDLGECPELFKRFQSILALAKEPDKDGRIRSADEVESLLIEEIRKLGKETLEGWAKEVETKVSREQKSVSSGLQQREKKR